MLTQAQGGTDTETQKTLDTVKEPKSSTHFFKKNKKQKRPSKGQSPAEPVVKPGQQLHWEEGHHAARHSSTQGKGGESRLVWRCSVFGIVAVVLEELAQGCIHVVWTVLSYGAGGEQEKKRKKRKKKRRKRRKRRKKRKKRKSQAVTVCMHGCTCVVALPVNTRPLVTPSPSPPQVPSRGNNKTAKQQHKNRERVGMRSRTFPLLRFSSSAKQRKMVSTAMS